MARRGSVRYSANRADDRLASTNDAMCSGATAGGHASGQVRAATAANSSASVTSAAATSRRRSEVPLCAVLAGFLVQQPDTRHRVGVGVPVPPAANDRALWRVAQRGVEPIGCVARPRLVRVGKRRYSGEAEIGGQDEGVGHPDRADRHVGAGH